MQDELIPDSPSPENEEASPASNRGIRVERLGAQAARPRHEGVYLPVAPAFLLAQDPFPVPLYKLADAGRLELFLPAEREVPGHVRREALEGRFRQPCYVRSVDNAELIRFEEKHLSDILFHPALPPAAKSRALHNLSILLSKEVLDKPRALNVYRHSDHVQRAVNWLLNEDEAALASLIRLSHRDYTNASHAVNTGFLGLALALELHGKSANTDFRAITNGFFLHDVGKGFVHPDIINKPGPLSETEWIEMKKHPQYGHWFLEREQLLSNEARLIVLQHHERNDGMGYPQGLTSSEIRPAARLCAIVDAFDALTTRRTFRNVAHSPFDALQIMKEEMHHQFDAEMFKVFVMLMKHK